METCYSGIHMILDVTFRMITCLRRKDDKSGNHTKKILRRIASRIQEEQYQIVTVGVKLPGCVGPWSSPGRTPGTRAETGRSTLAETLQQ